eukprot:Sspe_Gene.15799::Locus_5510_Transcript_2_2_Confidence_0.667_Length_1391::g.15799::m.15799
MAASIVSERLAQLKLRRRHGSSIASSDCGQSSRESSLGSRFDEISREKDRELERLGSRLKDVMRQAEETERSKRDLEHEADGLAAQLSRKKSECQDLEDLNDSLASEASWARDAANRYQTELGRVKRALADAERSLAEAHETIAFQSGRLQELEQGRGRQSVAWEVNPLVADRGERKGVEVEELQERLGLVTGVTTEVIRLLAAKVAAGERHAAELKTRLAKVDSSEHRSRHDPLVLNYDLEAAKGELTQMRKERNEALGALRAERAAHAATRERFQAAEAARDQAVRQLAEVPLLERRIDELQRELATRKSSRSEERLRSEKTALEADLARQMEVAAEAERQLAHMAKKRERAKRREHVAALEVEKLRGVLEREKSKCPHTCHPPPATGPLSPFAPPWTSSFPPQPQPVPSFPVDPVAPPRSLPQDDKDE